MIYFKNIFDLLLSIILIIFLFPLFIFIGFVILVFSGWPIFFVQDRVGINGKIFKIIKFRTMVVNAELMRIKYLNLNEASGSVFKIRNDPRYTKVGKILSHSGLDELPQLINVLKGEMSFVGPRPLPVYEYNSLKRIHKKRNLVKPGITSFGVICGSHRLDFDEWMKLDEKYIKEANLFVDIKIIIITMFIPVKIISSYILKKLTTLFSTSIDHN